MLVIDPCHGVNAERACVLELDQRGEVKNRTAVRFNSF